MSAIKPATIANRVAEQLQQRILSMAHFHSADDFLVLRWQEEIAKLAKVDRLAAALCGAYLAHMMGDSVRLEHELGVARSLNASHDVLTNCKLTSYSNLLFSSKALEVFRNDVDIRYQNIFANIDLAVLSGAFQYSLHLVKQAESAQLEFPKSFPRYMPIAAQILAAQGVTDDQCASVFDSAGEVLRARRLFWQETEPRVFVNESSGTVSVRFRVDTSPVEASQMTMQTVDKLIERGLDRVPLLISFTGTQV